MHVSTFYSYKGGVGRTFALVNVAVELAKSGRNVLLVDFDLEAPGIDTFEGFENTADSGGIVDFVTNYMDRKVPPNVADYVFEAPICSHQEVHGKVWVMPAGRRSALYDQALSRIHWQQLYDEMEGFLLFEDLKAQWKSQLTPDYVLIDSRTGHTDVGGICTRQLADLVVILFTPNEQNLKGLPPIVKAIRKESKASTDHKIELCFVASNVPTLDDEEGILRKLMAKFARTFSDDHVRPRIFSVQRYDSLQLLNQDIFTLLRPKSRLAKQYREIFQVIVEQNLNDRLGVLGYLKNQMRSRKVHDFDDAHIDWRIERILLQYPNDAEVLFWVARCYRVRSTSSIAIGLLEKSLSANQGNSPSVQVAARLELADAYIANQQPDDASTQLKEVAACHTLSAAQLHQIIRLWRLTDKPPSSELVKCIGRAEIDLDNIEFLIHEISHSAGWQPVAVDLLLRRGIQDIEKNDGLLHALLLSLIGTRQFDLLPEVSSRLLALDAGSVSTRFNVAMAEWAVCKRPDMTAFSKVEAALESSADHDDPNFSQCISLTYGILGDKQRALAYLQKAEEQIKAVPIRKFSCWRYTDTSEQEFMSDLHELRSFIESGAPSPLFLRE